MKLVMNKYTDNSLKLCLIRFFSLEFVIILKWLQIHLIQGSQTQCDSRAAWDSKKGLRGGIEKSEKNYLKIFS